MKLFFALIFLSSFALAAIPTGSPKKMDACEIAKIKEQEVAIFSENLANEYTTKTESGEIYGRKFLKCKGTKCKVASEKRYVLRFVPGHPEANDNGYVRFPKLNMEAELAKFLKASEIAESAKAKCNK